MNNRSGYELTAVMLVLIGVFNAADYYFTETLAALGGQELNPLTAPLINTPYFAVLKLIVIPLLLLFIWLVRKKINPKRLQIYTFVLFLCYFSLMLYFGALFGFLV